MANWNVAIIDHRPLLRRGLAVSVAGEGDLEVAGEAGNAREALALVEQTHVDVAVIAILMPDISGFTLAAELNQRQPTCRVLGLSVSDEPGLIADMLRAHAHGVALATQPVDAIMHAIRTVLDGRRYLPPNMLRDAVEAELGRVAVRPLCRLSKREREVFELLIRGFPNADISTQLCISRRTVETHRQRVMNKLSAHTIVQLQRLAARYGLLVS